jgi:hypothetical protein
VRRFIGPVLATLLAACATTPELGWQARHAASEALREATRFAEDPLPLAWTNVAVTATPVPINDAALEAGTGQLVYAGGVHITSDFNRLHGLSDIKFEDATNFWSITDEGLLVRGRIQLDASGRLVGVEGMQVRPLVDPDNQPLIPKYLADAEGLALMPNGELLVSFERAHRVWRYDREGRWLGERVIPDFAFTENAGMEGIASAGADEFWVAGENGGNWLCGIESCSSSADSMSAPDMPEDSLRPTSLVLDPGDPARIWVLLRAYHADRNTNTIAIQQRVVSDGAVRWLRFATFTAPATVDNFEGIAAVRRSDGGVRLYILSDDNFNPGQRTLLLAFDVR